MREVVVVVYETLCGYFEVFFLRGEERVVAGG